MLNDQALISAKRYLAITAGNDLSNHERNNTHDTMHPDCLNKHIKRITSAAECGRAAVTEHAIERCKERLMGKAKRGPAELTEYIRTMVYRGRKVRPKRLSEEIGKLVKHTAKASYHQWNDGVAVLVNDSVVTVLYYDPSFWRSDV